MTGRWLIEDPAFEEALGGPVVVVDAGSRGELFEPLDRVDAPLRVYAFEPDEGAETFASTGRCEVRWARRAVWDAPGEVDLHVAQEPSASSVYPPNMELLRWFEDRIGAPARRTARTVKVPVTSIDAAVEAGEVEVPHLLKLDIHSSEYEALLGARATLGAGVVAALVEAWHWPIHAGQHLYGEIETYLFGEGFLPFHFHPLCSWPIAWEGAHRPDDRGCLIGSETLFLRPPDRLLPLGRAAVLAEVALAELFGYRNFGRIVARDAGAAGVLSAADLALVDSYLARPPPAPGLGALALRYARNLVKALLGYGLR